MNSDWRAFLASRGGTVDEDGRLSFAEAEAEPPCALVDLSHLGLIRLAGEDTRTFLQGQVTNDVRQVSEQRSHLSGICSPKGRMIANFRVFERDGDLYLQLPRERAEVVAKRLRLYILRAKVQLEDVSDELVRIGLVGECAEALLPAIPEPTDGSVAHAEALTVIRHPGPTPRFELIGPAEVVAAFWEKAEREARPASRGYWELMDIRAGIPNVYADTAEAFVPQMANMQLVDGVSFTKGCYTGQEVVARMQYLGKLKRRMYAARLEGDAAPVPGQELYSPGSASGQGAGRVVDARPSPEGGIELLVVAEIASAEGPGLRLGGEDGPALEMSELPYAFPADEG
jgi:folate-binding protein YgfZ